jgi:hypothetical protein
MIFGYHKTLIRRDKFLRGTVKHRLRDPSDIRALDFKGEFRRSAICSPSATIANQWVDYSTATTPAQHPLNGKKYRQPRRASAAGKV